MCEDPLGAADTAMCSGRPTAGDLFAYDQCDACVSHDMCGYCAQGSSCQSYDGSQSTEGACPQSTELLVADDAADVCGECSQYMTCRTCLAESACEVLLGECVEGTSPVGGGTTVDDLCAPSCNTHTSCSGCTQQAGCTWCESMGQCVSSATITTEFCFGQCFRYAGETGRCPIRECEAHDDACDECLAQPRCGWCAAPGLLGEGRCLEGTMAGPGLYAFDISANCSGVLAAVVGEARAELDALLSSGGNGAQLGDGDAVLGIDDPLGLLNVSTWNSVDCPDADECALGTDTCNDPAVCVNENPRVVGPGSLGFRCECPENYTLLSDGVTCEANCDLFGCVHGRCARPNECECFQGWYGLNCTEDCGCNGHCRCTDPDHRGDCLGGTTGADCERCAQGFHGVAADNGTCLACLTVCNGQSSECVSNASAVAPGEPVCFGCSHPTTGRYCHECADGFFIDPAIQLEALSLDKDPRDLIVDNLTLWTECVRCRCNGHSDMCNSVTGEECQCEDNTRSAAANCNADVYGSCWHAQCDTCVDSVTVQGRSLQLTGDPRNGARCLVVPSSDAVVQQVLGPGELVSFQVTPKFTNVDMRLHSEADRAVATRVRMYVLQTPNVTVDAHDASTLRFSSAPLFAEDVVGLTTYVAKYTRFNLLQDRFYVTLHNIGANATEVVFYFTQPVVNIDLLVFFTVFFSSFFLVASFIVGVAKLYVRANARATSIQEQTQLQVRARQMKE